MITLPFHGGGELFTGAATDDVVVMPHSVMLDGVEYPIDVREYRRQSQESLRESNLKF